MERDNQNSIANSNSLESVNELPTQGLSVTPDTSGSMTEQAPVQVEQVKTASSTHTGNISKKQERFLAFLLSKNLLTTEQWQTLTTEISGPEAKDLELLLVKGEYIKGENLTKAKAEFLNLPYVNLGEIEIKEDILNNISSEVAENYKVICFDKQAKRLSIGLVDPENYHAIEAIDFLAIKNSLQVEYYLISSASFANAFRQYQKFNKEVAGALKQKEEEERLEINEGESDDSSFEDIVRNAPVAKIVNEIIKHAVDSGASDVHIEPMEKDTRVRYRVDGILQATLTLPKNIHDSVIARIKVMSKLKLDETRVPQGGRIRLLVDGKDIDFRVSVMPLMGEEKVVMRVLDTTKGVLTLDQLGFTGSGREVIETNIKKTVGILLITGPTGSGKSTTLYSILNSLKADGVNIVTLEDPVEYFVHGVNQSQIRPEIGFTFASGLRSLLRQDPDVMMVGEIRDAETAELAIHAALTGHLVLSTLHTNDAIGAVPRLLDMGIEPFLLGSVLNVVVAQRLARRLCPYCRKAMNQNDKIVTDLAAQIAAIKIEIVKKSWPEYDPAKPLNIYEPVGCLRCGHSGYKSRVCINEVLDIEDHVKEAIINKHGVITEEDVKANQPFLNVNEDGLIKVCQGITSLQEIMRVMNE